MTKIRTMRGKSLDVTAIQAKNETKVAIGNANMNARGDILGPGGKVKRKREEVAHEYHQNNPKAVRRVSLKEVTPDVFLTPAEVIAQAKSMVQNQQGPSAAQEKFERDEQLARTGHQAAPAPKGGKKLLKDDFND